MNIAYCTNVRLPSERAHGHQIAHVCNALAALGHAVTIFCPYRTNTITDSYWAYHQADTRVRLQYLGTYDFISSLWFPGTVGLWATNWSLGRALQATLHNRHFDLLYTRTPALLSTLLQVGTPVMLELHSLPRRGQRQFVAQCNQCNTVACLTSAMAKELQQWGVDAARIVVAGDAVDLTKFHTLPTAAKAREILGVTTQKTVVGYVGRLKTLGKDKGVSDLLKALKHLQATQQFFGLIVGGPPGDCAQYQQLATTLGLTSNDVQFTGAVPANQVPTALAACDIVAMPWPNVPHYRNHMSPLKMFEYMAASKPIVTSDLPTIRDVLSEETAFFCRPDDSIHLAEVLQKIAADSNEAKRRAANASALVQEHTWEKRMEKILLSLL